jgi:hypothetical protein
MILKRRCIARMLSPEADGSKAFLVSVFLSLRFLSLTLNFAARGSASRNLNAWTSPYFGHSPDTGSPEAWDISGTLDYWLNARTDKMSSRGPI